MFSLVDTYNITALYEHVEGKIRYTEMKCLSQYMDDFLQLYDEYFRPGLLYIGLPKIKFLYARDVFFFYIYAHEIIQVSYPRVNVRQLH